MCLKYKLTVNWNISTSFGISLSSSSLLSLYSSKFVCFENRSWSNLNVLFRWNSYHEWRNVNKLLSDGNMSLSYQNSCMMNWICELSLWNKSLKSSLHELVKSQTKNVIELSFVFFQQTELYNSSNEGISFKLSSWVRFLEGEELSCGLSDFCKKELDSPDFSFIFESVLTDDFQFLKKSVFIEGLSWCLRSFPWVSVSLWH